MFKILKKMISSKKNTPNDTITNIVIKVSGMKCEHCSNAIKDALSKLSIVKNIQVDLKQQTVSLSITSSDNIQPITETIQNLGFDVVNIQK